MSSCKPIFTYFLWKNVLLLYLVGEIVHAQIRDVTSECHSPEVRNGSLANITCIFSRDIDALKQKIYVDHIPPGSATATPETVLQCQWSGGNFTCNPKSGYKWTGYVSNRLTFEIPVTLQTHGGQYWCEVLPSDPLNIKRCDLHVTGLNFYPVTGGTTTSITTFNDTVRTKEAVKTTCVSQPVEYGSKAFVNCCFSVDIRDLKKPIFVDHLSVNGSGTPKTVLRCRWMKENILCDSSTGYHLIGNVTKELIIHIPSAHKQHAGLYWCDFLASKPEDIKNCSLSITDVQSSFRTTVNGNTGRTDVQSSFRTTVNGNTGRTDSVTESVQKDAVNITAIAVPIAVFLATIIIIIFVCLKRYVRRRRCPCRSNSERQCRSNSESQGSTNNPAQTTNPESIPLRNGGPNQLTTANGGESSRLTSQFTT